VVEGLRGLRAVRVKGKWTCQWNWNWIRVTVDGYLVEVWISYLMLSHGRIADVDVP
jgi:hypothetical protein